MKKQFTQVLSDFACELISLSAQDILQISSFTPGYTDFSVILYTNQSFNSALLKVRNNPALHLHNLLMGSE